MAKSHSYMLEVGKLGYQRLEEQNQLYQNASRDLILRAGLREGIAVLEVGCGTGIMSSWIAGKIGAQGKLIAADISPEQLEFAKMRKGADLIKFEEWDILIKNEEWVGQFDLIYCRFLLGHLTHPKIALKHMSSYLSQGGVLACDESAGLHTCFCTPFSEALDKMVKIYQKCQEIKRTNSLGNGIYHDFIELGLENIQANLFQPLLTTPDQKKLLLMVFQEFSPKAVELQLITEEEASSLSKELSSLCQTDSFIGYLRNTQIYGYRGAR